MQEAPVMDGQGFDNLTKWLAIGSSRRSVLKHLASGAIAGLAQFVPGRQRSAAAHDRTRCDDGLRDCFDLIYAQFRIDVTACVFDDAPANCRAAAKIIRNHGLQVCRHQHCACPAGTTLCGDISNGLCCEANEECQTILGSAGRCVKRQCPTCEVWDGSACKPKCGPCETCDTATETCNGCDSGQCQVCQNGACVAQCDACQECIGGPLAPRCVEIDCGDPCLVCQNGACTPLGCDRCHECRGGTCQPIDCGDPCLVCKDGACVPKACGDCEECVDGACQAVDCGSPCLECANNACRPKACDACAPCDPTTGACTPIDCGDPCLVCENGACRPRCGTDQTCCGGDCVDTDSDSNNCGSCGKVCADASSPQCRNGLCGCPSSVTCPPDGHCCTDLQPFEFGCCCNGVCADPGGTPHCCCNSAVTFFCENGGGYIMGCCNSGEQGQCAGGFPQGCYPA
jgi:hypothetical protein